MDYDNLIRICVDGIYFKGDTKLYNCFRHKNSLKVGNEQGDSYVSNIYKYLNFNCGEEREFYQNELHIGQGGNGKTHMNLIDKGLVRPLYIAPSWKLSSKKHEEYGVKNNVWANIYTTDIERIDLIKKYHNTIIIDEVSMMTEDCKNYILDKYKDVKLIFCGDVGFQAPPFNKGGENAVEMNCEGFKKVIHHKNNYRFKCDKLISLIKKMRMMIDYGRPDWEINSLVKEYLIDNSITRDELKEMYNVEDMILSRTHNIKNDYTEMFNDIEKWYVVENTRNYKNGQIIIGDKPLGVKSLLQHAYTIHSIQGETARNKLFIDITKVYDGRILYTAISRAIKLEQIFLVK
jgi:hypothetical protein